MSAKKDPIVFVKEAAKYFMDFLETDFHKRRNPKRSVKLRNNDNLLIGLDLHKYPSFSKLTHKAINKGFDKKKILRNIKKGDHRTNIPKNLLELIKLQVDKIANDDMTKIVEHIKNEIENNAVLYKDEFDKAIIESLDAVAKVIFNDLVLPLINSLIKPLENLNIGDEESLFLMEEELTDILVKLFEDKIADILRHLIAKEAIDVTANLEQVFDIKHVKSKITNFFENFKATDIFSEIFEMDRNRGILDKQEFYFYFCDITYRKTKYPIFYIPFNIIREIDSLKIEFDSQVFINKKALEFIVQEYNIEKGLHGKLKQISDRIIYLAEHADDFSKHIQGILNEIINFFSLESSINIVNSEQQISKGFLVKITNACYFSLFDNSDEALINDYEEILKDLSEDTGLLAEGFNKLLDDFINKDPKPFYREISDQWDSTKTSEKLVYQSPIPLNSEQRQIISAINKKGCKYITAEGPPGTGKSHTITAIACDAILNDLSILVLSDKKEALDVVEDKITETMNHVRIDKNFQNPILRLGKSGNTYNQILSNSSIENIRNHYRATRQKSDQLNESIDSRTNELKDNIEVEIFQNSKIKLSEINQLLIYENSIDQSEFLFDFNEVENRITADEIIRNLRESLLSIRYNLSEHSDSKSFSYLFNTTKLAFKKLDDIVYFLRDIQSLIEISEKLEDFFGDKIELLSRFNEFSDSSISTLNNLVADFEGLKSRYFGYLFKKKKVEAKNNEFKKQFPYTTFEEPHKHLEELKNILNIFNYAQDLVNKAPKSSDISLNCLSIIHLSITNSKAMSTLSMTTELLDHTTRIEKCSRNYPKLFKINQINPANFKTLIENKLTQADDSFFEKQMEYLSLKHKITKDFNSVPQTDYLQHKNRIEDLVTTKMTHLMDERVIDFFEHNRATAKTLREIIKKKKRFPRDEFQKLKKSFPCILAGIRDYSDYIPLEPEIFDLVIIDEASQVSIAQAFPALLRAKQIVVFGDRKQFSNVKAAHARSDANREYLTRLSDTFKRHISNEPAKLVRLEKFNIKTSVLEFFEFIVNFSIQLAKHFRGYKELISYSNKYFYKDSLQVMKIRGKSIDDVLKFSFLDHDGMQEPILNTNKPEIDFVISELNKLNKANNGQTVGIITPHTNQQKLLMESISNLKERDDLFSNLRLKIMTFDTCQGEERDIIYYSMVATNQMDRLWGIFIKDLNSIDIEDEGKIKAQRLNVGFSRAKECMHFILSKPLNEYKGSIGDALSHYINTLEKAKEEKSPEEVDSTSPMEKEVLNWFYQTSFWKNNSKNIDFRPQFKIGEYLKQLDRTYDHPKYIVDFLLLYNDNIEDHKIIIEYDGFQEHFKQYGGIDEHNYTHYYSDEDVYRQKVLMSYGYEFLRINKFNLGKNPIAKLDERLNSIVKKKVNPPV